MENVKLMTIKLSNMDYDLCFWFIIVRPCHQDQLKQSSINLLSLLKIQSSARDVDLNWQLCVYQLSWDWRTFYISYTEFNSCLCACKVESLLHSVANQKWFILYRLLSLYRAVIYYNSRPRHIDAKTKCSRNSHKKSDHGHK